MPDNQESGLRPIGEQGAQLKQKIEDQKPGDQKGLFDPGASMLGTDNEAGSAPDPDGMAEARNAPPPA